MLLTFIAIGVVVGFLPRPWYLIGILAVGLTWPLIRVGTGVATIDVQSMIGEFAIAAINAAVGTVIGRLLVNLVIMVRG
jgi:hypothetical protein